MLKQEKSLQVFWYYYVQNVSQQNETHMHSYKHQVSDKTFFLNHVAFSIINHHARSIL